MKIVRDSKEITRLHRELELTDGLAQECEAYLRQHASNPDEIPHISLLTLVQAYFGDDDSPLGRAKFRWKDSYSNTISYRYLTDCIHDWLTQLIWEVEPELYDSDVNDFEDDCQKSRYGEFFDLDKVLAWDNPDFPRIPIDTISPENVEVSPEGAND